MAAGHSPSRDGAVPDEIVPERPEELPFTLMARLFENWLSWPKVNGLPPRRFFDPLDHTDALPHLVLFDVEVGPPRRFRLRVVGTEVVENFGRDSTGQYIDAVDPSGVLERHQNWLCEHRRPFFWGNNPVSWINDRGHVQFHGFALPFSDDGQDIDKILHMILFR